MESETINKRMTRRELIKAMEVQAGQIERLAGVVATHHEMIGVLRDQIDHIAQAVDTLIGEKPKIITPH